MYQHQMLRNQAASERIGTNTSNDNLIEHLWLHHNLALPDQFLHPTALRERHFAEYESNLNNMTLNNLADLLPANERARFDTDGFMHLKLEYTPTEQYWAVLALFTNCATMGIDPTDATSYTNGDAAANFEREVGWLRAPVNLPAQRYFGTHYLIYEWSVAFHALLLLRIGARDDDPTAIRACIELSAQTYNSKLRLPSTGKKEFAHVDADLRRPGIRQPAPQIVVLTSPAETQLNGAAHTVHGCKFYNMDTPAGRDQIAEQQDHNLGWRSTRSP